MSEATTVNGVNVTQLLDTIHLVKENPEVAAFQFRVTNQWVDGTHNRATVGSFFGALKEDSSRDPMMFEIDEPPVLCGKDIGANPVEYLLVALSGCLTTTMVAYAAVRNIQLKKVQSRYEGDLDLRGFLGLADDVPVGYRKITVYFRIDADIPDAMKEELLMTAQKHSPVFNSVAKPVPVAVKLDVS